MIKFFRGISNVIVGGGNVLVDKNTPEFKRRFEICMSCTNKIKIGKAYFCSICGCEIHAKTKSPNEMCLNKKW